jgi:soluble lytic murein transglycosylase-like protein
MPNLRCCSSYQALRKSAIFCLTLGLLSTSTPTIGESADDAPLGSDNPAQVLAPSDGSTASEQDSAGDEPIVVELDIPPQLAAFLDEQKANSPQAPTAAALDGDTASGAADANVGAPISGSDASGAAAAEPAVTAQSISQSTPAPQDLLKDLLKDLPYRDCFTAAAGAYQLEELLLIGIAVVESSLDPNAVSSADALGLMQIKWPITANHLGIDEREALFDPCTNVDAGARYLRELLDDLSSFAPEPRMRLALASYRLGPNGFDPNVPLPDAAQDYIKRVQAQRDSLAAPADNAATASVAGPVLPCLVQNLRQLAAVTHDPSQRNAQFGNWLNARGQGCSTLALIQIRNNMPTWLGTGLTPELESQVKNLLASSIEEPERETSRQRRNR